MDYLKWLVNIVKFMLLKMGIFLFSFAGFLVLSIVYEDKHTIMTGIITGVFAFVVVSNAFYLLQRNIRGD